MSPAVNLEYLGFSSTTQGREYTFHVRFSVEDSRDYTVIIAGEVFSSRRVSYQDGPNVCSSRLKRELIANPDIPTGTSFLVDEKEIEDYKLRNIADAPKRRGGAKLPTA